MNLASALSSLGRHDRVGEIANHLLTNAPNDRTAVDLTVRIYNGLRRLPGLEQAAHNLARLNPVHPEVGGATQLRSQSARDHAGCRVGSVSRSG